MKVIAFVPIKLHSQRLTGKNLLPLAGRPLLWHVFHALQQVKGLDDVVCYCSDPAVQQYLPQGVTFRRRPTSLDADATEGLDIYTAFAREVVADYYLLCHATSPFVNPASLQTALDKVMGEELYDSAFAVQRHQTFAWYQEKPLNYSLQHVPRTQEITPVFIETSAFYLFSRDTILQHHRRIGDHPYLHSTTLPEALDIDTRDDYELALSLTSAIEI